MSRWRSRRRRDLISRLLLIVVVARALLPIGYMPTFSLADGDGFHFVICGGVMGDKAGPSTPAGPDEPDTGNGQQDRCVFSALPHVWQPPDGDATVLVGPWSVGLRMPADQPLNLARRVLGPHVGARAPPVRTA